MTWMLPALNDPGKVWRLKKRVEAGIKVKDDPGNTDELNIALSK